VDVEGSSVLDSVRKVQSDLATLLEHEHASLALAQRCSSMPSGTPLFSSIMNYRHNATPFMQSRISEGMETLLDKERTNYPFNISIEDFGSSLGLTAQIIQPYDSSSICGYMQQALQSLAEALEHSPGTSVEALEILPSEERKMIVQSWNETDTPFPSDKCIHHLFEDQVEISPEAVAIVHDDRCLTYRELNNCANQLAIELIEAGVKSGDFVPTLLMRSIELVAVQLAIIKIGAAYVPIDPKAPSDRQVYIATDCGAQLLITDEVTAVPDLIRAQVFRVSQTHGNGIGMQGTPRMYTSTTSSVDTAYVMYTSGSTGLPKGVMVPHRAIARLVINNGYAEISPGDHVAFATNPSFDPSTYDVWAPLLHGARIVIIDHETYLDAHRLEEALDRYKITSIILTMALFHQYAFIIGPALSKLKYLICGGEQGLIEAFSEVLKLGGRVCLINAYGPTEATTIATTYEISSAIDQLDRLPIGRPMSNTQAYVLDKHRKPVPIGVVGELYIGGPGVAIGYLNRPDLTAERFLPDPFSKVPGARMYKS
ncbi:hypothetical protein BGX28_001239, partial [Mortierella sp. GBA30]